MYLVAIYILLMMIFHYHYLSAVVDHLYVSVIVSWNLNGSVLSESEQERLEREQLEWKRLKWEQVERDGLEREQVERQ